METQRCGHRDNQATARLATIEIGEKVFEKTPFQVRAGRVKRTETRQG